MLRFVVTLALLAMVSGGTGSARTVPVSEMIYQQDFQVSYRLTNDSVVRFEENDSAVAVVEVLSWDRDEVRVEAVKRATRKHCLEGSDLVVQPGEDEVSIRSDRTSQSSACEGEVALELRVTVPTEVRVFVGKGSHADELFPIHAENI
jgi:hypothetical protein